MTLGQAKVAVCGGTSFGDVWPRLGPADGAALRRWYLDTPGVPVRKGGPVASPPSADGNLCSRCGGFLVRTGTCLTCQGCGESSGGCG